MSTESSPSPSLTRSLSPVITVSITILLALAPAFAQDTIERARIEYLIRSIEGLKGAVFIRNGSEHDGRKAAAHLRMKWEKAGSKVVTAEDFIRLCASKSSMTGKPYSIRHANGQVTTAERYFRSKLLEYNQSGN